MWLFIVLFRLLSDSGFYCVIYRVVAPSIKQLSFMLVSLLVPLGELNVVLELSFVLLY